MAQRANPATLAGPVKLEPEPSNASVVESTELTTFLFQYNYHRPWSAAELNGAVTGAQSAPVVDIR